MPDVFSKAKRSKVMSRIRSRGNEETELAVANLLRRHRITGWRRQVRIRGWASPLRRQRRPQVRASTIQVRPDFVFAKVRLALFVDGCFWHGCPAHSNMPENNRAFWRRKLSANKARDLLVTRALRRANWRVLRIWEHELTRRNEGRLIRRLSRSSGGCGDSNWAT